MEYLIQIIEAAAEKLGSKKALADYLEISGTNLSDVIARRRGLPDIAQAKLEELMELRDGSLRAPSAIITEKKPERVKYWKKKLHDLEKLAACVLVGVTLNMSPSDANARPSSQVLDNTVYYVKSNAAKAPAGLTCPAQLSLMSP